MSREEHKEHDFNNLGIEESLLKRINALGFKHPTPIQYKAIPIATSGEDVVGIAQTGSGKTLAFSIPTLQIVSNSDKVGLILLPTRELAVQVEETIRKIAGANRLRTAIIIGGMSQRPQAKALRARPHVIVATPGRLIDHIEQKNISLNNVGILVLDEADRMLDMGFAPQLDKILSHMTRDRQTMLFSATMPSAITEIARKYMKEPLRIEIAKPGTTAEKVTQEMFIVNKDEKINLLGRLLKEYKGSVLVFSRTRHGATKIAKAIRDMKFTADEIHSNRTQNQRQKALRAFTVGKVRILVATDIAARGIDVDNVELVVNFDLPDQTDDYVHRIGRTARAGREGTAISFACPDQKGDVAQIQKLINMKLPIRSHTGEALPEIIDGPRSGRSKKHQKAGRNSNGSRGSRPPRRNSSSDRSSGGSYGVGNKYGSRSTGSSSRPSRDGDSRPRRSSSSDRPSTGGSKYAPKHSASSSARSNDGEGRRFAPKRNTSSHAPTSGNSRPNRYVSSTDRTGSDARPARRSSSSSRPSTGGKKYAPKRNTTGKPAGKSWGQKRSGGKTRPGRSK